LDDLERDPNSGKKEARFASKLDETKAIYQSSDLNRPIYKTHISEPNVKRTYIDLDQQMKQLSSPLQVFDKQLSINNSIYGTNMTYDERRIAEKFTLLNKQEEEIKIKDSEKQKKQKSNY